jgi:hypothetical protein
MVHIESRLGSIVRTLAWERFQIHIVLDCGTLSRDWNGSFTLQAVLLIFGWL